MLPGGGGGGEAAPKPPRIIDPVIEPEPPEPEPCYYWVEETYYEDTGEVIDRTDL